MTTRAMIGLLNAVGTVEAVYCRNEGYLEGVGEILQNHYKTEESIQPLLKNLAITRLGDNINSTDCFCSVWENDVQFLPRHRTFVELTMKPHIYTNEETFLKVNFEDFGDVEFLYLLDVKNERWLYQNRWIHPMRYGRWNVLKDYKKSIKKVTKGHLSVVPLFL